MEATQRCSLHVAGVNQRLERQSEEELRHLKGALRETTVHQPQKELVKVLQRERVREIVERRRVESLHREGRRSQGSVQGVITNPS